MALRHGQLDRAEALAREGLKWRPTHAGLRDRMCEAMIAQNRMADAEQAALDVLKLDEKDAGAMLNLSRIYFAQKKIELALLAANNAREIAPKRGDIYHQLGVLALAKNERPQALSAFRKAVEADPS